MLLENLDTDLRSAPGPEVLQVPNRDLPLRADVITRRLVLSRDRCTISSCRGITVRASVRHSRIVEHNVVHECSCPCETAEPLDCLLRPPQAETCFAAIRSPQPTVTVV